MQLEFFEVPSPCVGICQSDDRGYCKGCLRTRDERQQWITLTSDDKQKVIKRCIQRKKRKDGKLKAKEALEEHTSTQPSLFDQPSQPEVDNSTDLDFGDFEL